MSTPPTSSPIVSGSFHQGDLNVFSSRTAGKQCVANCVVALAKSVITSVQTWNQDDLDNILLCGDSLYTQIHGVHEYLEYEDIPKVIKVYEKVFTMKQLSEQHALCDATSIQELFINSFLQHQLHDIIILFGTAVCSYASSIIINNDGFYIFDSHARSSSTGLSAANGSSTLYKLGTVEELVTYMTELAKNLNVTQISLWNVEIRQQKVYNIGSRETCVQLRHPFKQNSQYVTLQKNVTTFRQNVSQQEKTINANTLTSMCEIPRVKKPTCTKMQQTVKKSVTSPSTPSQEKAHITKKTPKGAVHQQKSKQSKKPNLVIDIPQCERLLSMKKQKLESDKLELRKITDRLVLAEHHQSTQKSATLTTQKHNVELWENQRQALIQQLQNSMDQVEKLRQQLQTLYKKQSQQMQNITKQKAGDIKTHKLQKNSPGIGKEQKDKTNKTFIRNKDKTSAVKSTKTKDNTGTSDISSQKNSTQSEKVHPDEGISQDKLSDVCEQIDTNISPQPQERKRRLVTQTTTTNTKLPRSDEPAKTSTTNSKNKQKQNKSEQSQRHDNLKRKNNVSVETEISPGKTKCTKGVSPQQRHNKPHHPFVTVNLPHTQVTITPDNAPCSRINEDMSGVETSTETAAVQSKQQRKQSQQTKYQQQMQQIRQDEQYRANEREQQRTYRQQTRSMQSSTLDEAITEFLQVTSAGPIHLCAVCLQTHFRDNVVDINRLHQSVHSELLQTCVNTCPTTPQWLCKTCKKDIYQGVVPKLSTANKVGFPERPPELELYPLEETLIAPLLPFMRITSLPVCGSKDIGQKQIAGNVVHVPNNIASTVEQLPRMLTNMGTVTVQLKRMKRFKTNVFEENIRPSKVIAALDYLVKHSPMYTQYKVTIPQWLTQLQTTTVDESAFLDQNDETLTQSTANSTHTTMDIDNTTNSPSATTTVEEDCVHVTTGIQQPTITHPHDHIETDEEDSAAQDIPDDPETQGNIDTLLNDDMDNIVTQLTDTSQDTGNTIFALAPGEGQIPVFRESRAEYLSFPTIFCGQERPTDEQRHRKVHVSELFKAELRHSDNRVNMNIPNIFWKAKHLQVKQLQSKVTLALRRVVGAKHKKVTAKTLLNPETREEIPRLDEGFYIFRTIRNSPPYFDRLKKDCIAMVRQLGTPTLFFSLSAADTRWTPLLKCLCKLVNNRDVTEQYIDEEMSFQEKCRLVAKHPAACSRYFHHRVQKFIRLILMNANSQFGHMKDYCYRVEFQKRGSPHIHAIAWTDLPTLEANPPEVICAKIDECISCSTNVTPEEQPFLQLQIHRHSRTCHRLISGKRVCRFGFPIPPMDKTRILDVLPPEDNDGITYQTMYLDFMSKLKKLPEEIKTFQQWLVYIDCDLSDYIRAVRSVQKKQKIFLKREPTETCINGYMRGLLHVWKANHDIQYILDTYEVITYVCDYMTKSQKGMSDLLHHACEEAKSGNMNLRQSVRHMANVFLNASESPVQECCFDILQLPISHSTRKKEYINTVPPSERVAWTKSLQELEELDPDSEKVTHRSNIDRYKARPRVLSNWCLAKYVAEIEVQYPENFKRSDTWPEEDDLEETFANENEANTQEQSDGTFPIVLQNGIILRRRQKLKIIRFRNYRLTKDAENYCRERLMLYIPWREESNIIQGYCNYEDCFRENLPKIQEMMKIFEPLSAIIDETMDTIQQQLQSTQDPPLLPSLDDIDIYTDDNEVRCHRNREDEGAPQFDIGPALGISSTINEDDANIVPNILSDSDFQGTLNMLNERQFQFYTHIMQMAYSNSQQVLCALHGGAGTGKSTVLRAVHQGLHRLLNKEPGQTVSSSAILLAAPTGKAAFNIHGKTLHRAFYIPANQAMEYHRLTQDVLNTARTKLHNVSWVLIDEFSMVGNKMLKFIHLRLQEIHQNHLPFGGINIICVGDLYQLQPVMQQYIFEPIFTDYGALATNLWEEHFQIFELTQIMRQQGDQLFAEILNRLRTGHHTQADICELKKCLITQEQSDEMTSVPHFFPTRAKVCEYNERQLQQSDGAPVTIFAIDTPPTDLPATVQERIRNAAKNKSLDATGNLPYEMIVKVGQLYDVIANVCVEDGIMNGAECTLRYIEHGTQNFPRQLWVQFTDPNIGKETRRRTGRNYEIFLKQNWTPLKSVTRSFCVKKDQRVHREQFPIQLCAARTIHKAQSATFKEIVIDMSSEKKNPRGTFWEHMHYVALSRCTSRNGLHIVNLNEDFIRTSRKVHTFVTSERQSLTLCYTPVERACDTCNIVYQNIGSIRNKWKALQNNWCITQSDIVIIAETWLKQSDPETCYQITDHTVYRFDSSIQTGHRGLMISLHNSLHIETLQHCETRNLEAILLTITKADATWSICGVYRPPSGSLTEFKTELTTLLHQRHNTVKTIVIGDININMLASESVPMLDFFQDIGLNQIVQNATTREGTLIDIVATTSSRTTVQTLATTTSHHHMLLCCQPL